MYLAAVLELSARGDNGIGSLRYFCGTTTANQTRSGQCNIPQNARKRHKKAFLEWVKCIMIIHKFIISMGLISLDMDQASSLLYRLPTTSRLLAFFVTGPSLSVGIPSIRMHNGSRERNRPVFLYPRILDDGESSATRSADSPVPQALRSRRPRSRRASRRNRFPGT